MPQGSIKHRKICIGLVGCGRIAKNHVEAILAKSEDLELVAICDNDPAKLEQDFLKDVPNKYTDFQKLLVRDDIDLVVLTTPSGLHPEQTILAAQARKNVLTEKPMATCWQDGLKMVAACKKANVDLFVVHQNRLNPTVNVVKAAIDAGHFGKVYMLSSNVFWMRPQEYYDQASWRGTWQLDGGALMNQASHYVDLMVWFGGQVKKVQAISGTLGRKIEAEDSLVLNLQYEANTLGSMAVTMLTYPKNLEGSLTVIGERGTVRLGGAALNEIMEWHFEDAQMMAQKEAALAMNYNPPSVYGFGHSIYYQNLINFYTDQPFQLTDGEQGLNSLALLCAAQASARSGQMIQLPFED